MSKQNPKKRTGFSCGDVAFQRTPKQARHNSSEPPLRSPSFASDHCSFSPLDESDTEEVDGIAMLSGAANEDSNMMDSFPDSDAAIVVSSSLVDLVPDQILLHIFSFLPDSWNELAFVCKKWWHVLRSRDLHLTSRPSVSAVSVAWIGGSLLLPQTSPLKIMLNNQARHQPTDYLSGTGRQLHFNATMRGILVDWLVEVKQEFNLREETLALNVALVDRYLSTTLVSLQRGRLQLLGLAALLIAAKFHEIYPPELADYAGIADNIYPREDIVAVESAVLNTLGFDVSILTLYDFATFFFCHKQVCISVTSLCLGRSNILPIILSVWLCWTTSWHSCNRR